MNDKEIIRWVQYCDLAMRKEELTEENRLDCGIPDEDLIVVGKKDGKAYVLGYQGMFLNIVDTEYCEDMTVVELDRPMRVI